MILGISRSTAYECACTGQLPVVRYGRRIVVPAVVIRAQVIARRTRAMSSGADGGQSRHP